MKIEYAGRVCKGVRDENDDRALLGDIILDDSGCFGTADTPFLAAVCDGCGGYAGGGVAAETVLKTLLKKHGDMGDEDSISAALLECKKAVEDEKAANPELDEMCTTVAGCAFSDDGLTVFHAGDSRVYGFDGEYFMQLTRDHSLVQEAVDSGEITAEEALKSEYRSAITRCIGFECEPPEVHAVGGVSAGDMYIICSDGFWDFIDLSGLIKIIADKNLTLSEMADRLSETALKNGSTDNVSVCLVKIQK